MRKKQLIKPVRTGSRIMDMQDAEEFRAAAEAYTAENNTPEAARRALVKAGIYTKTGRLTKHYR